MHLSAFEDHFGTNACLKSLGASTFRALGLIPGTLLILSLGLYFTDA